MTQKVNPSTQRPAEAFKTAGSIAAGGAGDGYIVDGATPSQISSQDTGIDETVLNSFAETSSGTSFGVTIDGGEAYVYGSWLVKDTTTTVTLASGTNNQTVYVGWDKSATDSVIIGLESAFTSTSGDSDAKIPLFDFDTDSNGVTTVTDRREIGKYVYAGRIKDGDDSTDRIVFTGNSIDINNSAGTKRAELDDTGNLSIENTLTENASL